MDPEMGKRAATEQELVQSLIDSKVVNFEGIGSAVAKFGPTAVRYWDGDDVFCLTMKIFIRVLRPVPYRVGPVIGDVENLGQLRQVVSGELRK